MGLLKKSLKREFRGLLGCNGRKVHYRTVNGLPTATDQKLMGDLCGDA